MEKTNMSAVGSVVTAVVASLCCIGPVVVALIGVGSIGAFSVFESYRPYLIAMTAILLGVAFYLTYRKREVRCEDGTCKVESAGKWNKAAVWVATFLATMAITFPYLDVVPTQAAESTGGPNASVVLHIDGMDCRACAKGLEATLSGITGVQKATVKFEEENAIISYNPTQVQPERIVALVDETGYKATIADKKGRMD
jgi:copper chaperone CopZ